MGLGCGAASPSPGTAPAPPGMLRPRSAPLARGVSRGWGRVPSATGTAAPSRLPGRVRSRFALFNSVGEALAVAGSLGMGCWGETMRFWLPAAVRGLCGASSAGLWRERRLNPARSLAIGIIYFGTWFCISRRLERWLGATRGFCASRGSAPASPNGPCAAGSLLSSLLAGAGSVYQQPDTKTHSNLLFWFVLSNPPP